MGKQIVDAISAAKKPFVPIADADVGGFVTQLLDPVKFPGLKGAAVTNTAAVGGAGITLALKLLNGETVATSTGASQPNTVLLDPVAGRQPDRRGQGRAQGLAVRPRDGSAVAAQPVHQGLDDVRPEHGPRELQGRVTTARPMEVAGSAGDLRISG